MASSGSTGSARGATWTGGARRARLDGRCALWPTFASLAVLCSLVALGCDSCNEAARPPKPAVVDKEPVPEPAGLLAEAVVAAPGRTLTALRNATGSAGVFVPRSLGGLAANLFGLPLQVVEHFDEERAAVAAAALTEEGLRYGAAFRLRSTSMLIALSTKGADAMFTTDKDPSLPEAVFLVPTGRALRKPVFETVLVVLDEHLVVADSREGARRLGPYLTRTLAREPTASPAVDLRLELKKEALREPTHKLLSLARETLVAAPLPSHVRALLDLDGGFDRVGEVLGKLDGANVTVAVDSVGLVVEAELVAGAGAFDARPEVTPLGFATLADDVMVALSWAESKAARDRTTAGRAAALDAALGKLLGSSWTPENEQSVRAALEKLARGRGSTTTMGLRCTGIGLTGLAAGTVDDRAALDGAITALTALSLHEGLAAKLKEAEVTFSAGKTRILEVPDEVWRLRWKPAARPGAVAEEIDMLALIGEQRFLAAAGMETVDTLQLLHAPVAERSLAQKKPIVDALGRLEKKVGTALWLAVMLDPQGMHACRVGNPGGVFAAPVVLGIGPGGERAARAYVEVARPLLRVLADELSQR